MALNHVKQRLLGVPWILRAKRYLWRTVVLRHSRESFLSSLPATARILDVGCGNNSPHDTKQILPHCHYTGLDVGDYNQTRPNLADAYIVSTPEAFADEIGRFRGAFDAVVSNHNLEHCNDRERVLEAMLAAVKPGGQLYLAFPCAASVGFPSRSGTLNYRDDPTHRDAPPDFDAILRRIRAHGYTIGYAIRRHRPLPYRILGWINEGRSRRLGRVFPSTWAYYGFESIVLASRPAQDAPAPAS